jgi:catalase (peroxidase I)
MYDDALQALDLEAVKADLVKLFTTTQECWPADFGNYGPFFIRLAWHCSGSYRKTDGKGGCAGGRQRFEPERSWEDNTNLDKARALLVPIKEKYGAGLSWGDLFTLAGTTALRSMGTPIKQFCAGRIDSCDGSESLDLGPSPQQEKDAPCAINGKCKKPLGSTTVGLIYLNPEGPVAMNNVTGKWAPNPDPRLSVHDVRDSFDRMDHDDRDTVALIGGGHAFGKSHGACPNGPGKSPKEVYKNLKPGEIPWSGGCGTGKGNDTVTAGFEGPWTTNPLKWDNEFFTNLLDRQWEKFIGPAGKYQWRIKNPSSGEENLMRLTSDMSLLEDEKYLAIVKEFSVNMSSFAEAFDAAWTKLITKGGSWSSHRKCDTGDFPESFLAHKGMLPNDVVIV